MFSLTDSLLVMVLGLIVVFIGLAILIMVCVLMAHATKGSRKRTEPDPAPQPAPTPETAAAQDDAQSNQAADGPVIAAIAAAIAIIAQQENTGFRVRHIRRVNAWGKSGREELLSSKMF